MSQVPPPPPGSFPPPPSQGFPPASGMGSQQYTMPPGAKQSNGAAIGSLVCGILGCIPFLGSLLAIILGVVGLSKAKKPGVGGKGMAIAGIILGVVWLGVYGLAGGGLMALFKAAGPARDVANALANDLVAGNIDSAQARVTGKVTRDELTAASDKLKPLGTVTNSTLVGVSVQANPGTKSWALGGALSFGQTPVQYIVKVDDVNGTLKVDGFQFVVNGTPVGGGEMPAKQPGQ